MPVQHLACVLSKVGCTSRCCCHAKAMRIKVLTSWPNIRSSSTTRVRRNAIPKDSDKGDTSRNLELRVNIWKTRHIPLRTTNETSQKTGISFEEAYQQTAPIIMTMKATLCVITGGHVSWIVSGKSKRRLQRRMTAFDDHKVVPKTTSEGINARVWYTTRRILW